MNRIFEFDAWIEWIYSHKGAWLFLLILGLVIMVVIVWSGGLRSDGTRKREDDS